MLSRPLLLRVPSLRNPLHPDLRHCILHDFGVHFFHPTSLDGKTFAEDSMVIALGITLTGEKVILGFERMATENETVCAAFLRELVERGLRTEQGLLCVIDGAKGLRKAIQTVFGDHVGLST